MCACFHVCTDYAHAHVHVRALQEEVYSPLAVALHPGEFQPVSVALAALTLGATVRRLCIHRCNRLRVSPVAVGIRGSSPPACNLPIVCLQEGSTWSRFKARFRTTPRG